MQDWAKAIQELANDPEQQKEMGQRAHEHVKQFTWERFVSKIDAAVVKWVERSQQQSRRSSDGKRALRKKAL